MTARPTVLLVRGASPQVEAMLRALEVESDLRVLIADCETAPGLVRSESPELILIPTVAGEAPHRIARALRAESGEDRSIIVVLPEDATVAPAPVPDADFISAHALDPGELFAWLGLAKRMRAGQERITASTAEIERLRDALSRSEERMLGVLVGMIDLALPGTAARGNRNATLARQIAMRFGVPLHLLRDLELAARLHELGRVVSGSPRNAFDPSAPESERGQYTLSTVATLRLTPELEGAAEMIANIYENWDGTGFPDHWLQGQIPLRCRILRVLVDFFAALERGGGADLETVLDWIEEHAGTRYDPMVVAHLKAVLGGNSRGEWVGSSLRLPITELRVGMVLAEDLYTDSGLKLLSRNTEFTPGTLQIILRRHRSEPILQGAAVLRRSA